SGIPQYDEFASILVKWKTALFIHSHQPDSLEMYFSNQPDNLYYQKALGVFYICNSLYSMEK
ncbi:hypothetical protein, partial [Filifactor alocis]|uniref:hypothetical protein n=1 Tax=Filifactor alocis TaxID=143361 RepID=UPI0028E91E79